MSGFTSHGAVYPFKAADTGVWTWALAEDLEWQVIDATGQATGSVPKWRRILQTLAIIAGIDRW